MGSPGFAIDQNFDPSSLTDTFPDRIEVMETDDEYPSVRFDREIVLDLMEHLRDERGFVMLSDLTGADFPDRSPRLEVIYNLYHMEDGNRLLAVTGVPEDDPYIDSVTPLWKAARWYEREVYDMFGVEFRNHPQHKRMLLYEEFEGHPLRKDYPKKKRQPLPMYYEKEDQEDEDGRPRPDAPPFSDTDDATSEPEQDTNDS